ncbi:MAG: leucine-rich repeat domain-containing protein [Bacteroidales bacterium]|nr:leucine-rich repeat domain-containing protein [Bacteroidales bacterium]
MKKRLLLLLLACLSFINRASAQSDEIIFELKDPSVIERNEDAVAKILCNLFGPQETTVEEFKIESCTQKGDRFYVKYSPSFSAIEYNGSNWGIKSIIVPTSVTRIKMLAGNIEKIVLPNTVKRIDPHAFGRSLKEITLSSSLTEIPTSAFYCCKLLRRIVIPKSVKSIGERAFKGCELLEEIELQAGLETIGSEAFAKCKSLKTIRIPKTVKEVAYDAFYGCTTATTVYWPKGLDHAPSNTNTIKY